VSGPAAAATTSRRWSWPSRPTHCRAFPPSSWKTPSAGPAEIFDGAQAEDWESVAATAGEMTEAWDGFKAGRVPPLVETEVQAALDELVAAIEAQDVEGTRQATLRVALPVLDLRLRHRTAAETDLDLLDVWARQLLLDATAGDQNAVIGDAATLKWIRDRIARDVSLPQLQALDARSTDCERPLRRGTWVPQASRPRRSEPPSPGPP
jgi:hypothetical protein